MPEYQKLELLSAPSVNPITRQQAKDHLRVDVADDDALIDSLILAATDHVSGREGFTKRALVTQTWKAYFKEFSKKITLPLPPVQSITNIKFLDEDGVLTTLSTDVFTLSNFQDPAQVFLQPGESYPCTQKSWDAVQIEIVVGYAPIGTDSPTDFADGVPEPIKSAMLLFIGDLYQNREAGALVTGARYEINSTAKALLNPYRIGMGF